MRSEKENAKGKPTGTFTLKMPTLNIKKFNGRKDSSSEPVSTRRMESDAGAVWPSEEEKLDSLLVQTRRNIDQLYELFGIDPEDPKEPDMEPEESDSVPKEPEESEWIPDKVAAVKIGYKLPVAASVKRMGTVYRVYTEGSDGYRYVGCTEAYEALMNGQTAFPITIWEDKDGNVYGLQMKIVPLPT